MVQVGYDQGLIIEMKIEMNKRKQELKYMLSKFLDLVTGKLELLLTDLENTAGRASLWKKNQEFILNMLILTSHLHIQVEMLSRWLEELEMYDSYSHKKDNYIGRTG